ncbi:exodeoxyribonuclease III [Promicromonospora citrea]|uniref:Putative exodeoxyribonuclease III protein XthA n=1 Tax=Promicromonospora citrea TaxID=43677 RepID=A0A8H9GCW9_9MICO|nr:exodeoxyribonuclease III [Promicromonospora citrea]NNH53401.1 exodeoxyribonuclease III [Promicromonospora citrea]GGM10048.1 putative exodeoxyribonuclease III protein XthA [Promicromonospora citrea]
MRLVTWNVNSVRTRVDRVLAFLDRSQADVLAIQETKCRDDQFPTAAFEAAGYEVAHFGLSQWNGVAIASRVGLDDVATRFPGQPGFAKTLAGDSPDALLDVDPPIEARAIGATCGGVRVWSLYVPHGRALDDPHYTYKLAWLDALRTAAQTWADAGDPVALLGDWNVIPLDTDVYDPAAFVGKTHVSPPERAAFDAFADAGYAELTRRFLPGEHLYTYWDYQQLAFPRNKGLRIDFCWASPALAPRATGAVIDRDERKGKGASDHVPVIVDLAD